MLRGLFQGTTRKDAIWAPYEDFEKKLEGPFAMPMSMPLDFLKSITRDFCKEREVGRGGYGVVYKGVLQNGKMIAVKKLFENNLDDDQFFNEVTYLMGLKHKNVVQLLGYCAESQWEAIQLVNDGKYVMAEIRHRLICFEYVNNKSLDKYISVASCGLNWRRRFMMIRGICDALQYLHEKCKIVHLDLKPQNILMDDNMVPKIADFGMSRLFGQQESQIITASCKGTLGYMPPEYLGKGLISTKSDIFSLGVIIIELLIGSRDYPQNIEASSGDFIENVIAESMSEDEIGGLKKLFKKFDTDNSGTITFDELKDGLKRLGSALSENEIQMLMDAADIDRNGTIDCSEFVAATLHTNNLEREENLGLAFSCFDKDANGFITTDELSQACSDFGLDVVHLEHLIKDINQNKDGRIDCSDFSAMVRRGLVLNHEEQIALEP